jgi:hypothetical protein
MRAIIENKDYNEKQLSMGRKVEEEHAPHL